MLKLAFIPNLFNINEPLIFGMPVMLNPVFFIPMVFCNVVMGLIGLFATKIFTFTFNPAMSLLPWTTPFFVKALLAGGVSLLVMVLILLAVNTIMYYHSSKLRIRKHVKKKQPQDLKKKVNWLSKLSKDFLWGGAIAANQAEGAYLEDGKAYP